MIAPVFAVCSTDPKVKELLGAHPVRLYPFGMLDDVLVYPYAVWQNITGSPENYLAQRPDADFFTLQVDAYADTVDEVISVATALRDAIEPHAHITRWGGQERDPETKRYRYSFDVDWIVNR
ncbi:tail completion protein gp17 [Citrobacter sp. C411]|uniref:tail completion protein gp17 n=1 Tax=Citrobacter sp. C411 TaxID=3048144 RepID=UPI0039C2536F